jgi:hypothetical protein
VNLGQELVRRRHEIDLLEIEFSRIACEFSQTDQYEQEGSITPIDWIRHNCHMTGPAAGDRVEVGEHLRQLSESVCAVEDGAIGFAHLAVLARTAHHAGERFNELELLPKACECSPGKLRDLCWKYEHARNPEDFARRQAAQIEDRRLRLNGWADGTVTLSGIFDPLAGAAIRTALDPLARPLGSDDRREIEQRYADALVELVSGGEQKAQIQVTATVDMLAGHMGSEAADVLFARPVCTETVRRLACESPVTRVLFDSESVVIDVGRSKRTVDGPTRRALAARDGGCRWPGCNRPAKWCAAHHVVHWIAGGSTDLGNLVLLCHRHHTLVHEGGWRIVRTEEGKVLAVPAPTEFSPWVRGPDPADLSLAS